ncbi:BLUF domain-containing protein [Mucilaginibacter sp.]
MYYLIYISTAVNLMSQQELADILVKSRANNTANNVTGILLYAQGTFIQALEGDEEIVTKTYNKIEKDDRHKNQITIITGTSKERVFADWSMAFISLDPKKMNELEGYINPLKKELFKGTDTNPAITVMKTFAENNNLTYNQ